MDRWRQCADQKAIALQEQIRQVSGLPYIVVARSCVTDRYVLRNGEACCLSNATHEGILDYVYREKAKSLSATAIQNLSDTAFIELKEGPHE